jgi:hypothetical protein
MNDVKEAENNILKILFLRNYYAQILDMRLVASPFGPLQRF